MTRFRKKPVEIDAWPIRSFVHGEPGRRALAFMPEPVQDAVERNRIAWDEDAGKLVIATLEGRMHGDLDDWLVRGIQGEFYACKPDVFEATYERAGAARPMPAESVSIDHDAARTARSAEALVVDGRPFPWSIERAPTVVYDGAGRWGTVTLVVQVSGSISIRGQAATS